jgi:cell wall-associated NlpC family hydrolase
LTLGIGGVAVDARTAAVSALPDPVAYTGVEYDGTSDVAERLLRRHIAQAAVTVDAHLVVKATKPKKPVTVQTASSSDAGGSSKPPKTAPPKVTGKVGTVVSYARAQVGKRYVFATAGPNTFDCSGLVKASYARIGVSLPHQTGGLIRKGRAVSRSQLAPGDLVFPSAGHVGIYIGGGQMVHASNPRTGVKVSGIYSFYAARRIL